MRYMEQSLSTLQEFSAINLDQLNAGATFLDRIDRKFLLTQNQLEGILADLKKDFYILDIAWKKVFSYDNIYMDSEEYDFYYQHQNKQKTRLKVRTRLYKDSNLAFFEFKQKQKWVLRKFRFQFPHTEYGLLTKEQKWFYKWVYASFYGDKAPKISPAMKTSYSRLTLVSKDSSERLTIDFNIVCENLRKPPLEWNVKGQEKVHLTNLVIVESKSMSKKCKSVQLLKSKGFKKAKWCSKYWLGVVYCGLSEKYSKFEETMKEIERIRQEL